jgi:hypothetical protein
MCASRDPHSVAGTILRTAVALVAAFVRRDRARLEAVLTRSP